MAPYSAIIVPGNTCLECGYTGEFHDVCPSCGSSNLKKLDRVVGFFTGDHKSAFKNGKQKETESRVNM